MTGAVGLTVLRRSCYDGGHEITWHLWALDLVCGGRLRPFPARLGAPDWQAARGWQVCSVARGHAFLYPGPEEHG